jgi:hypothetical protein
VAVVQLGRKHHLIPTPLGTDKGCSATYFFYGGLLMTLGSLLEFLLGNTFPFVVFGSFGKSSNFVGFPLHWSDLISRYRRFLAQLWGHLAALLQCSRRICGR